MGKSTLEFDTLDGNLGLSYVLKSGDPFPFVSLVFWPKAVNTINTNDHLFQVHCKADQDQEIALRIGLNLEGYTDIKEPSTVLFVEKTIHLSKGDNDISLDLNTVTRTPSWWFTNKPYVENDLPEVDREKALYLAIYDVSGTPIDVKKHIDFTSLQLSPTYTKYWIYSGSAAGIYLIILIVGYMFRNTKLIKVLIPIDLSEVQDKKINYPLLITAFIAENFARPDLKLGHIATHVGLTENQTSLEIKSHTGINFKPYLNYVRIEKSKQLLLETDRQVKEVAFEVGYNSAHHLIRVFKELEKLSPTEFRTKHKDRLT